MATNNRLPVVGERYIRKMTSKDKKDAYVIIDNTYFDEYVKDHRIKYHNEESGRVGNTWLRLFYPREYILAPLPPPASPAPVPPPPPASPAAPAQTAADAPGDPSPVIEAPVGMVLDDASYAKLDELVEVARRNASPGPFEVTRESYVRWLVAKDHFKKIVQHEPTLDSAAVQRKAVLQSSNGGSSDGTLFSGMDVT